MRFQILHEIKGRMRLHIIQKRMTDVVICYAGDRRGPISILQKANYDSIEVPQSVLELSGRSMNREYQDKIVGKVLLRFANKMFLPYPIRFAVTTVKSAKYIWKGNFDRYQSGPGGEWSISHH